MAFPVARAARSSGSVEAGVAGAAGNPLGRHPEERDALAKRIQKLEPLFPSFVISIPSFGLIGLGLISFLVVFGGCLCSMIANFWPGSDLRDLHQWPALAAKALVTAPLALSLATGAGALIVMAGIGLNSLGYGKLPEVRALLQDNFADDITRKTLLHVLRTKFRGDISFSVLREDLEPIVAKASPRARLDWAMFVRDVGWARRASTPTERAYDLAARGEFTALLACADQEPNAVLDAMGAAAHRLQDLSQSLAQAAQTGQRQFQKAAAGCAEDLQQGVLQAFLMFQYSDGADELEKLLPGIAPVFPASFQDEPLENPVYQQLVTTVNVLRGGPRQGRWSLPVRMK